MKDSAEAIYLYQAAVICALKAEDIDDQEKSWIVSKMCRIWASYQASIEGHSVWGIINLNFAVALLRGLVINDPDQYAPYLSIALNNLGSFYIMQKQFLQADAPLIEALKLRRAASPESEGYLVDLHTSLLNLGLLREEMGQMQLARSYYTEAINVCRLRVSSDPEAIVDLTRIEAMISLCLAKMPEAKPESLTYAHKVAENMPQVSKISPQSVAALQPLVDEVMRVSGISPQSTL